MRYSAFEDPYCYPGTRALRNIPALNRALRLSASKRSQPLNERMNRFLLADWVLPTIEPFTVISSRTFTIGLAGSEPSP
jgi:hypothetical protein